MDLIISSGYPTPYRTVAEELKAAQADPSDWYPMTPDFRATAVHSGGADEAASFDQLLKIIEKKKPGSISELGIVGHASQSAFSLSGTKVTGNIRFDPNGLIHPDTLQDKLAKISTLRDRFKNDDKGNPPSITLFACDAGSGDELLKAVSSAFQVTARGFQHEIWWCFMVVKGAAVRGRTWYDGVGMGVHPQCDGDQFTVDIRQWKPDKQKPAKP
jgi:hypothetical protein